jgi:hypothetical protein
LSGVKSYAGGPSSSSSSFSSARDTAAAGFSLSVVRDRCAVVWLLLLADFQSCFTVARPAVTSRRVEV